MSSNRSGTLKFEFEELKPRKGMALYAYGYATIDYEWDRGDPDVGCYAGYSYSVDDIYLDGDKPNEEVKIEKNDPLYNQICDELMSYDYSSAIIRRLEEHDAW